ncbi:hypothetical protein, partial [Microbacterium laevaniformans]|uniref:hypothetical protein n=1 Tax=Microbacterium laevaniformans TaxID=36807 RepID=UPI001ABF241A
NWKPTTRTATGPNEGGGPIADRPLIEPFERQQVPQAVELARLGKKQSDYFDSVLQEHWDVVVGGLVAGYVTNYLKTK